MESLFKALAIVVLAAVSIAIYLAYVALNMAQPWPIVLTAIFLTASLDIVFDQD